MPVAHDAASESAVSTSVASFSWTHTPSGTPRGAIVFVVSIQASADDTGVTYGGVAMNLVGFGIDNNTEPATVRCYYLDNVASGAQSIVVSRVNDATQMMGMAATVTAGGPTEAYADGRVTQGGSSGNTGSDTTGTNTGASGEVSVDDGSPGTDSVRYAAYYTGAAAPRAAGPNSTLLNNHDFGAYGWAMYRETTAGQGSRSIGSLAGSTDDRASVHIAVREIPQPTASVFDAVTITELVKPAIQLGERVFDAVTITEDVALAASAGVSLIAQYRATHRGVFSRVAGRVN